MKGLVLLLMHLVVVVARGSLGSFRSYFNESRVHSALGGQTPADVSENRERQRANILEHRWQSHCGGLYQVPVAA
jgi:hypothetical protein